MISTDHGKSSPIREEISMAVSLPYLVSYKNVPMVAWLSKYLMHQQSFADESRAQNAPILMGKSE
jgi:hypothetical protein